LKAVLKHIVANTYKPVLEKYLSKTRSYRWKELSLSIPPEVFHPGFFSSTHFLLQHMDKFPLDGKSILELGAGSGLISMYAAKKGGLVTSTDINPVAVKNLIVNSSANDVSLNIIQSDLFENVPASTFDLILINPPYYKKDPVSHYDHAWYCGANGEYFARLFKQMRMHYNKYTQVVMVLSDGCDIPMIGRLANESGAKVELIQSKKFLLEKNFLYKISYE
jgi:release factor glutamine methyltransferase